MSFLKNLDVFPKYKDDLKVKTLLGSGLSLCSLLIMLILFIFEVSDYLSTHIEEHLVMDTSEEGKLPINFNITLVHLPCSMVSLDIIDQGGGQVHVSNEHIIKTSVDKNGKPIGPRELAARGGTMKESVVIEQAQSHGVTHDDDITTNTTKDDDPSKDPNYCGSCYGAESTPNQCCNTCEDIQAAYHAKGWGITDISSFEQCKREGIDGSQEKEAIKRGEGCNIAGYIETKRGQGNFHIAPGYSFSAQHNHLHDFGAFQGGAFDTSHIIYTFSFGESIVGEHKIDNPLDNTRHISGFDGSSIFQYYAKVVPTKYTHLNGLIKTTNQYSITMHETKLKLKQGYGIPGIYFFYEFSPLMVNINEIRPPFFHFITQLCAIIGGIFTITGLIDRLIYGTLQSIKVKKDLGKHT